MSKAIVIREYGEPCVLKMEYVALAGLGDNQVRLCQTAIGVNFHDCYVRSGLYKTLALPGIPGCEAVGVVEEVGRDVTGISVGDRIAYVTGDYGAYAEERILDADLALKLPDGISDSVAATKLLRAMTVEMLLFQVAKVKAGDTILVHAAAGGVGRLLCQWAHSMGVTVIGTVGSEAKAQQASTYGCAHTILYRQQDVAAEVHNLTSGKGVDYVFDSVGADTFEGSLAALKVTGHLINFGQSSGPIKPVAMAQLAAKSITLSRPILFHYIADKLAYQTMGLSVFDAFLSGFLSDDEATSLPLMRAEEAHIRLENRSGGGSMMLVP